MHVTIHYTDILFLKELKLLRRKNVQVPPDNQIEIIKPEMAVLVIWLHMVANTEPTNGKPKQNALNIVSLVSNFNGYTSDYC